MLVISKPRVMLKLISSGMSGHRVLSTLTCVIPPERNASSRVSFCLLLLWCLNHVLPPRDAKDEVLGPSHHHSQGAAGGEPPPPLERPEPRRSSGVVRFDLDVKQPE
ncbi:Myosin-1 [Dissostichus eleginoides]|uniref:Myosin-1 n=2 Tax=Nototheniidae TaxID=8206 RepID=A0AAD9BGM2_DISEL|nr:Myosin-1 [Dissostichus eleginoides]